MYTGSCNTPADTERSNNSLYVTAAVDTFSDFLGKLRSKNGSSKQWAPLTSLSDDPTPVSPP